MNYVVVVRGRLKRSKAEAQQNQDPKDFLAVDFWDNIEAIQKLYSDPALAAEFGKHFDGCYSASTSTSPSTSYWTTQPEAFSYVLMACRTTRTILPVSSRTISSVPT